ncbi:unnamed protein product, partial [Meganyctiphanes norvegica]
MSNISLSANVRELVLLPVNIWLSYKRPTSSYNAYSAEFQYVIDYDFPKSVEQCRAKLREEFLKNANVQDIRTMDMLVIKGQMELKETVEIWKQKHGLMAFWKPTVEPKPKDFLSKFLDGHE